MTTATERRRNWVRVGRAGGTAAALIAILFAARCSLAPKAGPVSRVELAPADISAIATIVDSQLLTRKELAAKLDDRRYLLVGESHFVNEPIQYLLALLNDLGERPLVLLLELPEAAEPHILDYLEDGDEGHFAAIWDGNNALPYHDILRWARTHRERVREVVAMDENRWRIVLNRTFLRDTRNQSMAAAIANAGKVHQDALVVAYGGALHMSMGGRYMFDVGNRRPAGARLGDFGIPRKEIASLSLAGNQSFAAAAAWPRPGAVSTSSPLGLLPHQYFVGAPIYRAVNVRQLFDYVVNLGALTKLDPWTSPVSQAN